MEPLMTSFKFNFTLSQLFLNNNPEAKQTGDNTYVLLVEKIPQEVLARPDAEQIGFNLELSTNWVVDRNRDAFIILTKKEGGPYKVTQVTKYYTLSWKNELIHMAADPLPKSFTEQGAVMSWRVHKLTLPEVLQSRKDEVLQLIRDAFGAIGEFFNGERFMSLDVEFLGI